MVKCKISVRDCSFNRFPLLLSWRLTIWEKYFWWFQIWHHLPFNWVYIHALANFRLQSASSSFPNLELHTWVHVMFFFLELWMFACPSHDSSPANIHCANSAKCWLNSPPGGHLSHYILLCLFIHLKFYLLLIFSIVSLTKTEIYICSSPVLMT